MPLRDNSSLLPQALPSRRELLQRLASWGGASVLLASSAGCALLPWSVLAPSVHLLAVNRLPGEPLERRLELKLRIQNPNPKAIEFKGLALALDLNNRAVATGVTDAQGNLPAHGETLLSVAVTVSAAPEVILMLGLADGAPRGELPYTVTGRFTGGMVARVLGTEATFESTGSVRLPR